jgi:predicted secreted protein
VRRVNKKTLCIGVAVLIGLSLGGGAMGGQASASPSSSEAGPTGAEVQLSVGVFVVESGAQLALEIVREDPCVCLCDSVRVTGLSLLDGSGETVRSQGYDPAVEALEWLGRVPLVAGAGGEPLPEGPYTICVTSTAGTFSADVEVVAPQQMARAGRLSASASACGLELRLYRLITEEDDGADVALRQGDRLMVALAGNATTGFQWEDPLPNEGGVLQQTEEPEYRPEPHPETTVGYGGTFLFRYEAVAPGIQAFRFVYRRPWESVEPERVIEFSTTVY